MAVLKNGVESSCPLIEPHSSPTQGSSVAAPVAAGEDRGELLKGALQSCPGAVGGGTESHRGAQHKAGYSQTPGTNLWEPEQQREPRRGSFLPQAQLGATSSAGAPDSSQHSTMPT